jgi:hypothetical protein
MAQASEQPDNSRQKDSFDAAREVSLIVLAFITAAAAIAHALGWQSVDQVALYYLITAGVLVFLGQVSKFSLGKDSISFEKQVQTARKEARLAVNEVAGVKNAARALGEAIALRKVPPTKMESFAAGINPDDPNKHQWGQSPEANGRRLSAEVAPLAEGADVSTVRLEVSSVDPARPLRGFATFHLHPTFNDPTRTVPVADGIARLCLVSYGAFTVGAEADGGATRLELDLAEEPPTRYLPGVSPSWRTR